MKHLLRLLPFIFLSAAPIFAGNVRVPSDGAMKLVMTIPAGWKTSVDKDGVFSAESPDEELALAAWAVDKTELENFKDAPNKLGRILADCATGIRITAQPVRGQVGSVRTILLTGTGIDVDDKSPVHFRVLILIGEPGDVAVLYLAADSDVPKWRLAFFDQILRSVRPE